MKRTLQFLGTFVMMAVIGLAFITCSPPSADPPEPEPAAYHTVAFNANGGYPPPQPQQIPDGGRVASPAAMTKTNYGFGGWFANSEFQGSPWNFAYDTVSENITLYAKWTENFYTVTFNANGGEPEPEPQNISPGGTVTPPPAMNRELHVFVGWFTDSEFEGDPWNFDEDTVNDDITLYARWIAVHTVTFAANGGEPQPQSQQVPDGGKAASPDAMTKANYGFGGWFTDSGFGGEPWNFAYDTVTENITLHARWEAGGLFYTVTFDTNGGSPQPLPQQVAQGGMAVRPPDDPEKDFVLNVAGLFHEASLDEGYRFGGWYFEGEPWDFGDPVTGNITLTALWQAPYIDLSSTAGANLLERALTYVNANLGEYVLALDSDFTIGPRSFTGNRRLTILGIGAEESTIRLSTNGSLFTVANGVTLTLGNNITLMGRGPNAIPVTANNLFPLVQVNARGTLVMNEGSKITGNASAATVSHRTGGVQLSGDNATFTMNGGEMSGNSSTAPSSAGGVGIINANATFEMRGGRIWGNTASGSNTAGGVLAFGSATATPTFTMIDGEISGNIGSHVGGVSVITAGTFTMEDGKISGNTITTNSWGSMIAGGVYLRGGNTTFTMTGGEISGNNATNTAITNSDTSTTTGGVKIRVNATFEMRGGRISGNTAASVSNSAGGVFAFGAATATPTFTMIDGEISGNIVANATNTNSAGGVNISTNGIFEMRGGRIWGNTTNGNLRSAGGVRNNAAIFRISDGTIYGIDEEDEKLRNTVTDPRSFAALFHTGTGVVSQRGTFDDGVFTPADEGNLVSTNDTIEVAGGDLQ